MLSSLKRKFMLIRIPRLRLSHYNPSSGLLRGWDDVNSRINVSLRNVQQHRTRKAIEGKFREKNQGVFKRTMTKPKKLQVKSQSSYIETIRKTGFSTQPYQPEVSGA
ncbi:hypothetical protein CEXT_32041 [Caerostris extrusa]|uniref:Uncharacterized protein n=1 Tax=Caerostris extrusa TaxID=172846 RepID=A0AAV4S2A9_CAEEX|nr:hypothetical protein CEXT_32041 [Caerostris extrusa]